MLELRFPTASDEAELRLARAELAEEGHTGFLLDGFVDDTEDFEAWLGRVQDSALGRNLAQDRVPSTFLLGVVDGSIVGRISIRHELNEFLLNFGGHIGYMIRPAFRRRGYAREMLRQALQLAQEMGIPRALVTCNDDNFGSIRTIEANGGELENVVLEAGRPLRRYWIKL